MKIINFVPNLKKTNKTNVPCWNSKFLALYKIIPDQ